ncbi:hypothetical protein ACHQM5_010559 [Ranunculus cassubicifolius]
MKLFDEHCHLQDPRVYRVAPQLIQTALDSGVLHFAVNGITEKDWHLVKQMGERYPRSVIPCFGLHPWFVANRTANWFTTLKGYFDSTPNATVGEIGLDKGSPARINEFEDQVEVFRPQLELAKELKKTVTIHCVSAFDDLLEIMQSVGHLPAGAILHSYLGSAEMVAPLAKLGAYFTISGHTMNFLSREKAKKMLKAVPTDRLLLETDSPDALPSWDVDSLHWVPGDDSKTLNQPANIHNVLSFAASMLEISEAELAKITYKNAMRLFSCQD